jgi:ketosteroid isomerase-like protein
MSEDDVEIVRRAYDAMRVRDLRTLIELSDPEVEWIPDRRVGEGPIRGRESVIEFHLDRAAMFGQIEVEFERWSEKDDKVLVFLHLTGSGAASGAGFDIRIAHLSTLRDGIMVQGKGSATATRL